MNLKQRSMSSDIEITDEEYFESQNMPTSCKTYTIQNSLSVQRKSDSQKTSGETTSSGSAPKHQRARVSQVRTKLFTYAIFSILYNLLVLIDNLLRVLKYTFDFFRVKIFCIYSSKYNHKFFYSTYIVRVLVMNV